jgi:hypothetical protein
MIRGHCITATRFSCTNHTPCSRPSPNETVRSRYPSPAIGRATHLLDPPIVVTFIFHRQTHFSLFPIDSQRIPPVIGNPLLLDSRGISPATAAQLKSGENLDTFSGRVGAMHPAHQLPSRKVSRFGVTEIFSTWSGPELDSGISGTIEQNNSLVM